MRKAVLKIAYTLGIGAAVALCLGLVGCGKEQLATPQGVTVEKRIVSWEAVDGAESYTVTVNGEEFTTQECSYSLYAFTEGGEYTVTVSAEAEGYIPSVGASVSAQLQEAPFHGFDEAGYEYWLLSDYSGYEISKGTVNTDEALVLPDYFGDYPITQVAENGFAAYTMSAYGLVNYVDSYAPSITLPKYLKRISRGAFKRYVALEELVIPEGVEEIGVGAFSNAKLKHLTLPSTVKKLGNTAFSGHCLEELTLPEGLEEIGSTAFQGGTEESNVSTIKELTIPSTVKSIGSKAFANNLQLENIEAACRDLEYISSNSFEGTAWYEAQTNGFVYLDDFILYAYKGAFYEGDAPNNTLRIEGEAKIVAEDAFYETEGLLLEYRLNIYVADSVRLCNGAFRGFRHLGNVRLPSDLEAFPELIFDGCYTMQSLSIPQALQERMYARKIFGYDDFFQLSKVYVEGDLEDWNRVRPFYINDEGIHLIVNGAEVYTYCEESPAKEGKYWRYVEGEIAEW